ncbi:1-phosphofructokinase [Streptacidiphilus pinicola]|uniref:1-phosphofructokinase n=1 Tax=Streptacidiphilus pinicola TaxID=2219663 RepID=A0A2X0JCZ5_9ACTN|nr:1-phosphofructokinase family hexose kinase [Streptacidiphilus pinicola]RAG85498.1 1-phosphofructokinase [Streptacidiphilus pinicola]
MILTVTLNAALDLTHRLDRLRPGASNRVTAVAERAGGKGVNVARVLHGLGHPTVTTGLVGGRSGQALRLDLAEAGIADELVPITGETRRTVAIVDEQAGATTILLEPGPVVTATEWACFLTRFDGLLAGVSAVVLSGSLPRGLPADSYSQLIRLARAHGVPAVLDTEGEPLLAALPEHPDLVKPNVDELASSTGESDPITAAARLRTAGARAVVASLGPDGLLALTDRGAWRARPPAPVRGNPTGAGDAAVAALTLGLVNREPWPTRLTEAVALSAAAVAAPLAGSFDPQMYARLLTRVRVEALTDMAEGENPCP